MRLALAVGLLLCAGSGCIKPGTPGDDGPPQVPAVAQDTLFVTVERGYVGLCD